MRIRQLSGYLTYVLLRSLSWLTNLFSLKTAETVARSVGSIMFHLLAGRRRIAMTNLTIAYGESISEKEKEQIAEAAFQHIAVTFMETFRIPRVLEGDVQDLFTINGLEHFDKALAKKMGMIFVISHIGSWEYLSFLFYLTRFQCSAIVRELRNPYIFKWLQSMRLRTSLNVITKENPINALKTIMSELSNNGTVAVLIDQWAGNDEPWVDFFGRPASTTTLPARLALKTGCALVPGMCIRKESGKYEITISPEISVDAESDDPISITKNLNHLLEAQIQQNPEQWIWTHKRWKGKKDYESKKQSYMYSGEPKEDSKYEPKELM